MAELADHPEEFAERVTHLRAGTQRRIEVGARSAWSDEHKTIGDLMEETWAWRAAGADHPAIWFGGIDGFEWRMRAG